jgi:hypothetical protein
MLEKRIRISGKNPRYWEYGGAPTVLIGGSVEDNLFQIADLEAHLDLLASCGGNYVRCTMSCRDPGDAWPFTKVGDAYDLDQWNPEFWRRFEAFLELAEDRGIIAQIELWATFDYYRENWAVNPFNPANNSNYTAEESGLPTVVDSHPVRTENPFFWSVPAELDNEVVLGYQQRFVDEMLRHSLAHGNVLYCMDNETSVTPAWGAYWSQWIKTRAAEVGVSVETTEMWDAHDLFHDQHKATLDHPEIYSFADVSQNNHQVGQVHWDNAQLIRGMVSPTRPLNNVKIYGADSGRYGTSVDGQQRFWRNLIGGMATARFHRPPSGLGLGELAQINLRSARMLLDRMALTLCEPHQDLLRGQGENGAFCCAEMARQVAVYMPEGGGCDVDLSAMRGDTTIAWLDVGCCAWAQGAMAPGGGWVALSAPADGPWVALITA